MPRAPLGLTVLLRADLKQVRPAEAEARRQFSAEAL
jgi:hypothetical protein